MAEKKVDEEFWFEDQWRDKFFLFSLEMENASFY